MGPGFAARLTLIWGTNPVPKTLVDGSAALADLSGM